jgi:hypothetical protein
MQHKIKARRLLRGWMSIVFVSLLVTHPSWSLPAQASPSVQENAPANDPPARVARISYLKGFRSCGPARINGAKQYSLYIQVLRAQGQKRPAMSEHPGARLNRHNSKTCELEDRSARRTTGNSRRMGRRLFQRDQLRFQQDRDCLRGNPGKDRGSNRGVG